MIRRRIDPATAAGIKKAVKTSLDTEQEQRDAEHNEMLQRILSHMDRFIEGEGNGRSEA